MPTPTTDSPPASSSPLDALGIRGIVLLLALGPAAITAAILFAVASTAATRITSDLADQALTAATDSIRADLDAFLERATDLAELSAARITAGEWPEDNLLAWADPAMRQLDAFEGIASVTWGTSIGETFWIIPAPSTPDEPSAAPYEIALQSAGEPINEFPFGPGITELNTPSNTYDFDATQRPWYLAGQSVPDDADSPWTWTPIYIWIGKEASDSEVGKAVARRVNTATRTGVVSIDVTLGGLSNNLRALDLAQEGLLLIADDQGKLVASSFGPVVGDDGTRRDATAALRAADATLDSTLAESTRADIAGEPGRVRVVRYAPAPGIDWRVAVAVPERLFLAEVQAARTTALLLAGLATLLVLGLSIAIAHRVARKAQTVNDFVHRIGGGDFDARLDPRGPREYHTLATQLNTMAEDLAAYVDTRNSLEVANQVQRSLLPEFAPSLPGLKIRGHSRYCDETGGDYFDYMGMPKGGVTIAVGDVMGHGVAAALLMATARAALRAACLESIDLATVMTRVNDVLAADLRHKRFMTMTLVTADPVARSIRWASAGHDPIIIYQPAIDTFTELDDGDLPLAIEPGIEYDVYEKANLAKGTIVFIGTDGIWETMDAASNQFGKDRLREIIRDNASAGVEAIGKAVEAAVRQFRGEEKQADDVTYVIVQFDE